MSEELNFNGNKLVHFQTIFVVGNVLGLLPFIYLFPRVPMHYLVPSLDLGWGIFTLLQYRAQSYGQIMAYRFLVSIFEASYIPGECKVLEYYKEILFLLMNDRYPFRVGLVLQSRRDWKERRHVLHWPHPRHFDCQPPPSGCDNVPGWTQRTTRLAMALCD